MNPHVANLQSSLGLTADGAFGPKTAAALRQAAENGRVIITPKPAAAAHGAKTFQGSVEVTEVIVHCSDTPPDWMQGKTIIAKRDEIDRWHRLRGFRKIGYHYLIDRDGTTTVGRPPTEVGAHVIGHNSGTLGVCLIGGHSGAAADDFAQHFTSEQKLALCQLIGDIRKRARIVRVTGHNQYAAKACPCFNVEKEITC